MNTRIALLGIIVTDTKQIQELNRLLSECHEYIIGRMGLPHHKYAEGELAIISIALEAPEDVISSLSGKIGMLSGISAKVIYHSK